MIFLNFQKVKYIGLYLFNSKLNSLVKIPICSRYLQAYIIAWEWRVDDSCKSSTRACASTCSSVAYNWTCAFNSIIASMRAIALNNAVRGFEAIMFREIIQIVFPAFLRIKSHDFTVAFTMRMAITSVFPVCRGVQYVYWVMHKCIMVKVGGKKYT